MADLHDSTGFSPPEAIDSSAVNTSSGSVHAVEPVRKTQRMTPAAPAACVVTAVPETPSPIRVAASEDGGISVASSAKEEALLRRREVLDRQHALARAEIEAARLDLERAQVDEELAASTSRRSGSVRSANVPVLTRSQIDAFNASAASAAAFNVERLHQSVAQVEEAEETPATDLGLSEFLASVACAPAAADPYGSAPADDWCLFTRPPTSSPLVVAGSHGASSSAAVPMPPPPVPSTPQREQNAVRLQMREDTPSGSARHGQPSSPSNGLGGGPERGSTKTSDVVDNSEFDPMDAMFSIGSVASSEHVRPFLNDAAAGSSNGPAVVPEIRFNTVINVQEVQNTNVVNLLGPDPMEGVASENELREAEAAREAVAAADAATAAALEVNRNQRLEFERQLAAMNERMGYFERHARDAANEAFEKGRAAAMEDRSTAAETAACSSNGQATRLDAYIIHTPPPTTEKVLASNVPVVPHFPLSGNVGMPTVTLLQPAEIVIHNGSEGTIFGTPEGQEGELAVESGGLPGCPSNGQPGGSATAPASTASLPQPATSQFGGAHSQGGQPPGGPSNGSPGGGPPGQNGQPPDPGKRPVDQPRQSPHPSPPGGGDGGGDGGGGGGDGNGPDGGSEDSDSSGGSQRSRATTLGDIDRELRRIHHKKKYKEADTIRFPNWPSAPGFRAYKNVVYQEINTASGRPDDKAMRWARELEDMGLPDSHFETVPKRFATLSRKIATAVQKNAHGELGRNITETVEDWIRGNRSVPGLVLLRMVFRYYSTGRPAEAMFNLNDLQNVKMINNNLEQYMNTLNLVLKGVTSMILRLRSFCSLRISGNIPSSPRTSLTITGSQRVRVAIGRCVSWKTV